VHLFQQIIDQHPQRNNMCPFPCISLSLLMRQSLFKYTLLPNRDRLFSNVQKWKNRSYIFWHTGSDEPSVIIIFHTTYTKTISDRLFRFDNNQCSFPETSSSSEKQLSKQYHIRWRKCQKYFYVTHWQEKHPWHFLTSLSLYIFTIWKCIAYSYNNISYNIYQDDQWQIISFW
jgi:hypothetical protein